MPEGSKELVPVPQDASGESAAVVRMATFVQLPTSLDVPEAVDIERVKKHFELVEQFRDALIRDNDWIEIAGRKHLRKEALERLALAFCLTEGEPTVTTEWRDIPKEDLDAWPRGWTKYPVIKVRVVLASKNGRVVFEYGSYSALEKRRTDGKFYERDINEHTITVLAHKRAFSLAVKRMLGGIPWVSPDQEDDEIPDKTDFFPADRIQRPGTTTPAKKSMEPLTRTSPKAAG